MTTPVSRKLFMLGKHASFFFVTACLGLVAGCGGSGPTGTVSGTVTLNGSPIAAQVTFMNNEATASAVSDSATGQYSLVYGESNRIPLGTYNIAITAAPGSDEITDQDYEAMMEGDGASGTDSSAQSGIPTKFQRSSTSGLEFTVSEGDNSFDIKLE